MLSLAVGGAIVALTALHAAIFWSHLDSGRLFDPLTAGRWLLSLVLVGFLILLRRRGVPLLWGRRALVVWMLVVLLHWTAGAPAQPASLDAPHATGILFLLPATTVPLIAAAAALLFMSAAARATASAPHAWFAIVQPGAGRVSSCGSRPLIPRAPPIPHN